LKLKKKFFRMKFFAYFFVAVLAMSTVAMNTGNEIGVKVAVTQNALTYLKDVALPVAEAAALAAVIPDMTENVHVPVVGYVDLTLKNMKINRLSVKNSSVILTPSNGISVSVTGLDLDITLDWHYRESSWPHIADSGSGEGSTTSASASVSFIVGSDATGHPTAKISSCGLDLSSLSIKLHGGASWLYDIVIDLFHKKIVEALDSGICKVLSTDVQDLIDKYLSELPVQHVLGDYLAIDYSLADPNGIVITSDDILIGSAAGEFFPKNGHPGQAPGKPVAMPNSVTDNQFQIFVTDFSVESLGFAAVKSGLAEMTVTKDMVPAMAKDFFATDFYGQYAPGILDKYGEGTDCALLLALHQTPDVIFTTKDGVDVKAGVELTIRAMNKDGKFEDAFSIMLNCDIDGDAKVNNTVLSGELTDVSATATLVSSHVGDVDIDGINDLVQFALSMCLDTVNEILAKGTPLPTLPGLHFVNPEILYRDDYIVVATNIVYNP